MLSQNRFQNYGKALMLMLNFFCLLLTSVEAHSISEGVSSGGGGAQIESAFRMRAYELIDSIASSPNADSKCPADLMRSSLRATKIRIVHALIDTSTMQPVKEPNLDAWTSAGDMQLLKSSWSKFLDPRNSVTGRSIDVLILHEIYRATSGSCDDDGFQISNQIPALLTQPSKFSQVFALTHADDISLSNHNTYREHLIWCDADPVQGADIACALLYPKNGYQLEYEFHLIQGRVTGIKNKIVQEKLSLSMRALTSGEYQQIVNLLQFASATHPLFIAFDVKSGVWSYGFDLAALLKLH